MKVRQMTVALCLMAVGFALCVAPLFAQERINISFWNRRGAQLGEALDWVIAEFEKVRPEVHIEHRLLGEGAEEATRMAFLAGVAPDIADLSSLTIKEQLVKEGMIIDLGDWYAKYGDRIPKAVEIWSMVDGNYYGVPMDFNVLAHLYYNKDILDKYGIGVPQYWNEFMDACDKLKTQGELPIALGNKVGNTGEHWIQRLLTETIGASGINELLERTDPDAGPRWTDPKVVQAVQVFEDLHTKGYFPKGAHVIDYQSGKMMFLSGKGGFYEDGSWFAAGTAIPPDFNWGFFTFPHMKGEIGATRNGGVVSYLDVLAVNSASPHQDTCLEFFEFYTRREIIGHAFYVIARLWPPVVGALEGRELSEFDKAVLEFAEACDDNAPWLSTALPLDVGMPYMFKGQIDISAGKINAVDFCERLEKAHQESLRRAQGG